MNWKSRLLLVIAAVAVCVVAARGQDDKVCISHQAADECASCVVQRKEYRDLTESLKKGRDEDAKIIKDLELKLAMETQKTIDLQAQIVYQMKIVEFLLTNGRKKIKIGLINF